jgi:hypothetical protein
MVQRREGDDGCRKHGSVLGSCTRKGVGWPCGCYGRLIGGARHHASSRGRMERRQCSLVGLAGEGLGAVSGRRSASRGRAGRAATTAWTYGRRLGEAPPNGGYGGLLFLTLFFLGFSPSPPPSPSPSLARVKWWRWLQVGKTASGSWVLGRRRLGVL